MRVLIAGIVGGIIMFMWGFASHMLLPLGHMGVGQLPNEQVMLASMQESITEHKLYIFPGMPMDHTPTPEEQEAWSAKYRSGPVGIVVYNPTGREPLSAKLLGTEFGFNVLAVLLAALIVARVTGGYMMRVFAFLLFGVIGWTSLGASYWNWYAFPTEYSMAELAMEAIGWLLVGLVCAAIVKPNVTKFAA